MATVEWKPLRGDYVNNIVHEYMDLIDSTANSRCDEDDDYLDHHMSECGVLKTKIRESKDVVPYNAYETSPVWRL